MGFQELKRLAALLAFAVLTACAGAPKPTLTPGQPVQPVLGPNGYHSGSLKPYQINGRWYEPYIPKSYEVVGMASWYGDAFQGKPTSDGEIFDLRALTAAHKTLPLPSLVEVTNLANGRSVILRVNDRGPFVDSRIIDVSRQAATELGFAGQGLARVRVRWLGPAGQQAGGAAVQPPPAPPAAPAEPPKAFIVQVGAYSDVANAYSAADAFAGAATVRQDGALYIVTLGPFTDRRAAEGALARAVLSGFSDAEVIEARKPSDR